MAADEVAASSSRFFRYGAESATLSTLSAALSTFGLQLHRVQESLPFYTVERLHQPIANDVSLASSVGTVSPHKSACRR